MYIPPIPPHYNNNPEGFSGEPYSQPPVIRRIKGESWRDRRAFRRIVEAFAREDPQMWTALDDAAAPLQEATINPPKETGRIPRALRSVSAQERKKRRMLGVGAVAMVVAAGLTAVTTHEDRPSNPGPSADDRMVRSARLLAQLDICEADMYAQWKYDSKKAGENPESRYYKYHAAQDLTAMETARKAHLTCAQNPTEALAPVPGPSDVEMFVSRTTFTRFVIANWPEQRKTYERGMQEELSQARALDIHEQINAGDVAAQTYQMGY